MMYLITKLGLTNYMHIMQGACMVHVGVKKFCVIKSNVKEANKSQTNHKMFTGLYIIALLSNWQHVTSFKHSPHKTIHYGRNNWSVLVVDAIKLKLPYKDLSYLVSPLWPCLTLWPY